jgi:hypothetical protein
MGYNKRVDIVLKENKKIQKKIFRSRIKNKKNLPKMIRNRGMNINKNLKKRKFKS